MRLKISVILILFITVLLTARTKAFELNSGFGTGIFFGTERYDDFQNFYRLGVPCLKEKNISFGLREEAGVDLWFLPAKKMEFALLSAIKITKNLDGPYIFCGTWEF